MDKLGFKDTLVVRPEEDAIAVDEGSITGLQGGKRNSDVAIRHKLGTGNIRGIQRLKQISQDIDVGVFLVKATRQERNER